jgi:hypothetical protein
MTNDTTAGAVAILTAAYPRQAFPADSVRLYVRMLADVPPDALSRAVTRLIRRSTFLPSIAEIRREAAEETLALPTPAEAWQQASVEHDFRHPLVWESLRAVGGSWAIRTTERPEIVRAQFLKDYGARRDAALLVEMGAAPELAAAAEPVAAIPEATISRRAVSLRLERRLMGEPIGPPTDEERHDAILFLDEIGKMIVPIEMIGGMRQLHVEAQRVMDDADRLAG